MEGTGIYTPSSSAQTEDTALAESWLDQVQSRFHSSHPQWPFSENVCIYRVPIQMRISKPNVFDPFVVSLGPFHIKTSTKLSTMDKNKLEALHRTLERLNMNVSELIAHIKEKESEIRACYEEPIEWDGETLSWAFAMDACFILEFLNKKRNDLNRFSLVFQDLRQQNSIYFGIMNDIMKMENQIPLFILKSLLKMEFGTDQKAEEELCLMLFATNLFEGFPFRSSFACSYNMEQSSEELTKYVQKNPAHLLDLYRMVIADLLTPSSTESASHPETDNTLAEPGNIKCCEWLIDMPCTRPTRSSDDRKSYPTAELLHAAGIKFKPGPICFRKRKLIGKGTFSLPEIIVTDSTVPLLRNVMAYEECQRCSWNLKETVISHYLVLLDYLIASAKDVSVLRKAGVISSLRCSDEDIACTFKNICEGITVGTTEGIEKVMDNVTIKKAKEYYYRHCKVLLREFQEEQCSKPWHVVSLLAGTLILAMTAVQTVYAVKK